MNSPIEDSATSSSSITLVWSPITTNIHTGALLITSYSLEWQNPSGSSWQPLVGLSSPYLLLTYTVNSGIIAGSTYSFRLRASNSLGWGLYSTTTNVIPSSVPS